MKKENIFIYIFFAILIVFLIGSVLYFLKKSKKTQSYSSSLEPEVGYRTNPPVVREPIKLPPKITYTIVEVKPNFIKVKTDKGEAGYTKSFMEKRGIYKMVEGKKIELSFSDLKEGQKLIVHTKEGKEVTGFEVIE